MPVENIDRLIKKLSRIDSQTREKILSKAVEKGAKRVQRSAKLLCPVNHSELRNSIKTTVEKQGNTVIGTVYTNKEYASYVEFGTGAEGEAKKNFFPPEISSQLVYSSEGWFIPGDKIEEADAERYHFRAYRDSSGNVKYYYTEGQAPQPFMFPAFEMNKAKVRNDVLNSIKKQLVDTAKSE
jgi:HK97 gp10 family phage protein